MMEALEHSQNRKLLSTIVFMFESYRMRDHLEAESSASTVLKRMSSSTCECSASFKLVAAIAAKLGMHAEVWRQPS